MPERSGRYTKGAVLILHWEEGPEKQESCAEEVSQFQKLFTETFQFEVAIVQLKAGDVDPQVQLNKAVTDLVYQHDSRSEERLLVVYYSGHGLHTLEQPGDLTMTRGGDHDRRNAYPHRASWSPAEWILRYHTWSDTLVILECCFAGQVLTDFRRISEDRCYEVMVATSSSGYTPSPGPYSYTATLIESLRQMRAGREPVTTWELAQTIMKKEEWKGRSNLHPVLFGRGGRHIVLAPPKGKTETTGWLRLT